nr:hypothetical protein [Tanacetum cinerariifolium]
VRTELPDDLDYPISTVEAAADLMVVSLAGRTIQDAEMFEQLVDHLHLSRTPEVGFPPSDKWSAQVSRIALSASYASTNAL